MSKIEPACWSCPVDDGDGPDISCNKEYAEMFKGKAEPLYPASALAAARREALEKAVAICVRHAQDKGPTVRADFGACIYDIRALIEKPDQA